MLHEAKCEMQQHEFQERFRLGTGRLSHPTFTFILAFISNGHPKKRRGLGRPDGAGMFSRTDAGSRYCSKWEGGVNGSI